MQTNFHEMINKLFIYINVFISPLILMSCQLNSVQNDTYSCLKGISNEGKTLDKPYLTGGDMANIIGTQDGLFPDIGGHVKDEMGGIWSHPLKMADGFWVKVSDDSTPNGAWLMEANEYISYPYGSEFNYINGLDNLQISRFQFVPNKTKGVIVEYRIKNDLDKKRNILLDFVLKTEISPVWFSKENGVLDYPDLLNWDVDNNLFTARDSINNWFIVWGTDSPVLSYGINVDIPIKTNGQGRCGLIRTSVELNPKEEKVVSFALNRSTVSRVDAVLSNQYLLNQKDKLLFEKQNSFRDLFETSKITIPDKQLETVYNWIRINTRWLEMDLDEFGRFLGAGAIEYPWLFGCDNSYALQGVLSTGDFELAKSTLTILKNVSERVNGNGRIIHEMSSNGFVYNKGNTQETAHFIIAVWKTFLWTGDIIFLKEIYPYIKKGIHWLTVDMDNNHDLFPEGYGIMEVHGLNAELIDVAVYTQQALMVAAKMAVMFNDVSLADLYLTTAATLKNKINTAFWNESEGVYCDFFGTKQQAISVVKGAIMQLQMGGESAENNELIHYYKTLISKFDKYPDNAQQGWFTNKNWVINTPMESAIAPVDKAIRCLDVIRKEHCGEYGPYLSAVERRRMMTIATGVQAVSEAQYGRIDDCLWYMNKIASTFSQTLPGSINEMMPDYGCPVQAWTIYGIAVPLIDYIFGVKPEAYNRKLVIEPNLPLDWNDIALENQAIGTNFFTIKIKKEQDKMQYSIQSKEEGWEIVLKIKGLSGKKYFLNGENKIATSDEIILNELTNNVIVSTK